MTAEEKNEALSSVDCEKANVIDRSVEENGTVTSDPIKSSVAGNIPKASHLRQRWRRKPSAGSTATIREDSTPQPKELETVQIPTAERLNYPKDTYRDENRGRCSHENDRRRRERCGYRNRREGCDKGVARHEKSCGCREGEKSSSCPCRSFFGKAKRFFAKLFGGGSNQSEEHSSDCKHREEQTRSERSRSNDCHRPKRYRTHRRPQKRDE